MAMEPRISRPQKVIPPTIDSPRRRMDGAGRFPMCAKAQWIFLPISKFSTRCSSCCWPDTDTSKHCKMLQHSSTWPVYPCLSMFIHVYPRLSTFIHVYPCLSMFWMMVISIIRTDPKNLLGFRNFRLPDRVSGDMQMVGEHIDAPWPTTAWNGAGTGVTKPVNIWKDVDSMWIQLI